VGDVHRYQQRQSPVVQIRRPDHLAPAGEFHDSGDQVQEGRFVVGYFLREQPVSVGVDHDAVMMGFAGFDTGPKVQQNSLQSVGRVEPSR